MIKKLLNQSAHRRATRWLRVRGADSSGKKAKRAIHRHERHQTRQQLREAMDHLTPKTR